jgi:hypothetical protein
MERNSSMERILKEISVQEKCEFKIISDDIKQEIEIKSNCSTLNSPDYGRILLDFGQHFKKEKIPFKKIGIKDKSGQMKLRITPKQIGVLLKKKEQYDNILKHIKSENYSLLYDQLNENLSKTILESDFSSLLSGLKTTDYNRYDGFVIAKNEAGDFVGFYSSATNSNINIVLSLDPHDAAIYGFTIR